jgi:hypothetical protein
VACKKLIFGRFRSDYRVVAMAEGESVTDEKPTDKPVDEELDERRISIFCCGSFILVFYALFSYLLWDYGGIIGFLMNRPFDLWFLSYLHIETIMSLVIGVLILILIWFLE